MKEVRGPKIGVNIREESVFFIQTAEFVAGQCKLCAIFIRFFVKKYIFVAALAGYLSGLATLFISHGGGEFLVNEFILLIGRDREANQRILQLESELRRRSQCFVRILDEIYEDTSIEYMKIEIEGEDPIDGHNCSTGPFCVVKIDLIKTALVVLNSGYSSEYGAQTCRISGNGFGSSLGDDVCINDGTLGRNSEQEIRDIRWIIKEIDELSWTVSDPEDHMKKIIDLLDFGNAVEPLRISEDIERLSLYGDLVHLDRLWKYYHSAHYTAFPEFDIRSCLDRTVPVQQKLTLCAE